MSTSLLDKKGKQDGKDLKDLKGAKDLKSLKSDKMDKLEKEKAQKAVLKSYKLTKEDKDLKDMKADKDDKGKDKFKSDKADKDKDKFSKDKTDKDKDKFAKDKDKFAKDKDKFEKDYKENKDKFAKDKDKDKFAKDKDTKDKFKEKDKDKDYKDKDYKEKEKQWKGFKEKEKGSKKKDKILKEGRGGMRGALKTRGNKSKRAGLWFPVAKVHRELKELIPARARMQGSASVYLTAVMEYVMAEVLEMAGNTAQTQKKKKITPRHLMLSIRNDDELNTLIKATIAGGGVVPDSGIAQQAASSARASNNVRVNVVNPDEFNDSYGVGGAEFSGGPAAKKQKTSMQSFPGHAVGSTPFGSSVAGTPFGQPMFSDSFGAGLGGAGFGGGMDNVPSHLQGAVPVPMFQPPTTGVNVEMKKKKKVAGKMQMPNMFADAGFQ